MDAIEFRAKREMCGLTQQHVADATGVSVRTVKRWEGGKFGIPEDAAGVIESAFEMHRSMVAEQVADALDESRQGGEAVIGYRGPRQFELELPYQFDNAVARTAAERLMSMGMRVRFVSAEEEA